MKNHEDNQIPDTEVLESIEEPILEARKYLMLRELGEEPEVNEDTAGYYANHILDIMSGRSHGHFMHCLDVLNEFESWSYYRAIKVLFIKHCLIILKDHYTAGKEQKGKVAEVAVSGADKGIQICDLILDHKEDGALELVNQTIQDYPIEPLLYVLRSIIIHDKRTILGELKVLELFHEYGASKEFNKKLESELKTIITKHKFDKLEAKQLGAMLASLFEYSHSLSGLKQ